MPNHVQQRAVMTPAALMLPKPCPSLEACPDHINRPRGHLPVEMGSTGPPPPPARNAVDPFFSPLGHGQTVEAIMWPLHSMCVLGKLSEPEIKIMIV